MDFYVTNPGPIDESVLYDQDKHVSSAVWEGQERGALRCHEHTSKLDQWALTPKQLELVHKAGFGTVSGCLTLLQCWSYYHLDIGRPKLNQDPFHVPFPLVLRWKGKQSAPTANRDLMFYRKALDSLKSCDVEWLPYINIDNRIIPEDIKSSLIVGRSKTMLICFDKAERHLPDRCLRQYGMNQSIPEDVQQWERKSRGVDGGVDLSGKMELELNEWLDRRLNIVEGDEGVEESEYMQWYMKITRRFVGRLLPLSSEFQRMHAALRDIAHIADTVSTQGMDSQQMESVTRIRYIVHECLRDQVGTSMLVSGIPQVEHRKRIRGKERVRRKSIGKRKRKDDPVQCQATSEGSAGVDAQLHTTIEVDGTPLCLPTDEVDDTETCIGVTEVDDSQHVASDVILLQNHLERQLRMDITSV
ncbi:hypothetical protein VitviT2T_017397 [Vitis vinifera]|uniref:Aminotransferase-like plant mobile domain-containing protein n=1 Tax=Vitis vinifera TaxID=29760 RepID=A0ABY9CWF7_VITVI|nr:hypothetical protein VitviT2T_017397 [Vitis vinifera]